MIDPVTGRESKGFGKRKEASLYALAPQLASMSGLPYPPSAPHITLVPVAD